MLVVTIFLLTLLGCGGGSGNAVLEDTATCAVIDTGTHFNFECTDGSSTTLAYPEGHEQGDEPPITIDDEKCAKFAPRSFKGKPGKSPVCWIEKKAKGKYKIHIINNGGQHD